MNVWYLSFHGGTERHSRNNIHIYSATGGELGKALNRNGLPDNIELRELRGFGFGPDGNLYVVNAYREASQILRFTGKTDSDGQHDFLDVFVAHHHERNPQLLHPFNFAFCRADNLYVSNQDTSCVSRYHGPHAEYPGLPMPLPDAIRGIGPSGACNLNGPAGMGFGRDGAFYVASRMSKEVLCSRFENGQAFGRAFITGLEDNPEFLLSVTV